MQTNLYAYTPNTHPYPEFVSLNRKDSGEIELTVREAAKPGQFSDKDCGATVAVQMPRGELLKLFEALRDELTPPMMKASATGTGANNGGTYNLNQSMTVTAQTITGTAVANFIPHGGNVSPAVKQLLNASVVSASATSAPAFFQLVDIIGFIPVDTSTLTTAQTILGSQTYPRYADGKGVQAFIAPVVVTGAGTPTLQLNYTNPASAAGRLTPSAPSLPVANTAAPVGQILYSGTGVGKYGPFMPLQGGDNGILSIQSIQQSASMTSGVYAIVLCKPIGLPLPLTTVGVPGERDFFNQLPSMPIIPDGACLSWLMLAGAATPVNTPYNFTTQTVWKV